MLLKAHRLTKESDFSKLARRGSAFYSTFFTVKILKNELDASRFGVVISKKISKKAVVRNRLKRQITEIIRLNLVEIKTGFDIMILVKSNIIEKPYLEIQTELLSLFKKAKLNV